MRWIVWMGVWWVGMSSADASTDVAHKYQSSYDLEARQEYGGALSEVDGILEAEGEGYLVQLRRGWLLYLLGSYADSAIAYRAATRLEPDAAEPWAGLALPLMALRRWSEAEQACRRVLALAPGNYTGMSRLAYVLYSAGRYAQAERQYLDVVELFPSDVEMRTGLGWARLKQGKVSEARASFEEVLGVAPEHVSASQGMEAVR